MRVLRRFLFIFCVFRINSVEGIPYDFCYKAVLKGNFNCENIYIWKSDQNDFISLLNVTLKKPGRSDLKALEGKTVKVIADNMPPYITSNNKSQKLGGFLGAVWEIVEDALNLKSEIVSVDYDTGVAIISRGNADVMLAAGIVKRELAGIEFSQPYLYNWYYLYIKQPEGRASAGSYLKTLSPNLWCVSGLLALFLTIFLWITIKFLHLKFNVEDRVSFSNCFLCVCSGFLNQGFNLGLITCTGRILVFSSLIPGYILYSSINAVLVARLATSSIPLPVNSINDVMIYRDLSMCLRTNSFVYNNFTDRNGLQKIVKPEWKGILNGPGCRDINNQSNLAAILCNDEIIILESRVVVASVVNNFGVNCDIARVNRRYYPKGNAYLLRRGFNGTKPIQTSINLMRSSGVLRKLEDKWMKTDITRKRERKQLSQVTINHIGGLLLFYFSLAIASLAILGIEIVTLKYIHRKNVSPIINPFKSTHRKKVLKIFRLRNY